jgi:hypothetical protein
VARKKKKKTSFRKPLGKFYQKANKVGNSISMGTDRRDLRDRDKEYRILSTGLKNERLLKEVLMCTLAP